MRTNAGAEALAAEIDFHSGDSLQLARTNDPDSTYHDVNVVGSVRDRSLLVTHPQQAGGLVEIEQGVGVQVRFYMRKQALGFRSSVLKVCESPYPYLHLAYPTRIEPLKERQSKRVRAALAATVRPKGVLLSDPGTPATVRDLSTSGAMLLTPVPVGVDGDNLTVEIVLPLDQIGDHKVAVPVTIRNSLDEANIPGSPWRYRYGVAFGVIDPQTTIRLRAYLYERFADV